MSLPVMMLGNRALYGNLHADGVYFHRLVMTAFWSGNSQKEKWSLPSKTLSYLFSFARLAWIASARASNLFASAVRPVSRSRSA